MFLDFNIQLFADGKVVIETDLDKQGFEGGLNKMQSLAKTGFTAIATSVGVASTAIAGLIGKSVTMAGDLEQQMGGTTAVFGEFASTVQEKAVKAFDQMGLSANDFMATANKMGALMQGSGLDIETSMELSTKAMQRAADVASIMGIDVNFAMESIAGAAKGNFTMMDNLGVAMNATTIEAYALSKGINESYVNMDNATKVGLAMEMFLEKTAYAADNYAKENETFAGSFNTLKAATSNFLSGAGGIEDVADALVDFGGILVESIGTMAPRIVEGLTQLTETLIPQIPTLLETLLPSVLEGAISLINGLVAIFPQIIVLIQENLPSIVNGAMLIIQTLISALIEMAPELLTMGMELILQLALGLAEALPELVPQIINAIILMLDTFNEHFDDFLLVGIKLILGLIEGLIKSIPNILANLPTILMAILNFFTAQKLVNAGLTLLKGLGTGLTSGIPELIKKIPSMISNIISSFKTNGLGAFKDIGKQLMNGLWNGLKATWDGLKNKVADLAGSIVGKFKSVFGIKSPSRIFRDEIGKYLAQGVGVGFENEIDSVYNDMQRAVEIETDKMSANVQTNGTYQMAMAGLPTFNLVDNANNTTQLVVNGKVLAEVVNSENRKREVAAS